jgi:hypothetical protein
MILDKSKLKMLDTLENLKYTKQDTAKDFDDASYRNDPERREPIFYTEFNDNMGWE